MCLVNYVNMIPAGYMAKRVSQKPDLSAFMEVFALPAFLPNSKLELLEAALESFPFPAFRAGRWVLPYELAQIFANQARQRRVAVHGYLADPFHQVLRQGKPDIHVTHNT